MYITDLADAARSSGLKVIEVPGWQTAGHGGMTAVRGVLAHHTAGSLQAGNNASLNVVINGYAGLPGPLCNLYLSRDGVVHVIAAGRAYHAGTTNDPDHFSNSTSIGIEAENPGDGSPWPNYDAYVALDAALCKWYRVGTKGHKETQPGNKIDPTFSMDKFRADVAAKMNATKPPAPAPAAPAGPRVLSSGMRGDDVAHLQQFLMDWFPKTHGKLVQNSGGADGSYGPATEAAVKKFQQASGLDPDGYVGPRTRAVIAAAPYKRAL